MVDICTNGFLDCDGIIGTLIGTATSQTTGDLFLTFFIIMIFLVIMTLIFGIRLEYSMIIILPLLLAYMKYYNSFLGIGIVVLIYLSIVILNSFFIK